MRKFAQSGHLGSIDRDTKTRDWPASLNKAPNLVFPLSRFYLQLCPAPRLCQTLIIDTFFPFCLIQCEGNFVLF
jgi:hypothetical protein